MYILLSKISTCKEGISGGIDLINFISFKLRNEGFFFQKDS